MKRLLCVSVIAVGVLSAVLAGGAGAAGDTTGAISYRVSYSDPLFGNANCVGVHLTGNGTATSGGVDAFICTITNHLNPGKLNISWCSDYFAQPAVLGSCVLASKVSITVGASGLMLVGTAVYP
jgi:hypothetical protein